MNNEETGKGQDNLVGVSEVAKRLRSIEEILSNKLNNGDYCCCCKRYEEDKQKRLRLQMAFSEQAYEALRKH